MTFTSKSLPDLSGRVYIVTGATSGIGFFTAAHLAEHGAHVYICARSAVKADKTIESIKKLYPKGNLSALIMDHAQLSTVVAAAKDFLAKETSLHGLINNAGIMCTPFAITKDGYEEQWQTNYIAHWVFTAHLLPILRRTSQGLAPGVVRIVNLSSAGHKSAPVGGINFADLTLPGAAVLTRYGQSKLGNILHARTLHAQYGPGSPGAKDGGGEVWTAIVHPGLVSTQLADRAEVAKWMSAVFGVMRIVGVFREPDEGSFTTLFCAASSDFKAAQSGTYFQPVARPGSASSLAKDAELAKKLEEWTEKEMRKAGWIE